MRTISTIFIISLLSSLFAATVQSQWVQMHGPEGGSIQCITFCGPYVIAGAYNAGIYRSSDNGGHWSPASDGLTQADIYSLAVCDNFLFAGTGIGVFSSSDQGTSWQPTVLMNGNAWALAAIGTSLFAGTNFGVYRSTDKGVSWGVVNDGLTDTMVLALATNGSSLYAGTQNGVFASTDSGTTWTAAGMTGFEVSTIAVSDTDLYAGTLISPGNLNVGAFHSTDNGAHWTKVLKSIVSCFAISDTTIYAGTTDFVLRSTDRGATWTDLWINPTGFDVRALAVSGGNLFAGTVEGSTGIYRSTDRGDNWSAVNTGLTAIDVEAMIVKGTSLFAGTSHGIFRSTDGGSNWTRTVASSGTCFAVSESTLYAGQVGGNGVSYSMDNGESWKSVGPFTSPRTASLAISGSSVFAGLFYQGIYRSTIGDTSWTLINNMAYPMCLTVNGTDLFAGGSLGVSHSTDNGVTWSESGPLGDDVYALAVAGSNIYAGSWGNGVYLSTDRGTNWTAINNGLTDPIVISLATVENNIFAGTHGGGIFLSTNNGESWIDVSAGRLKTRVYAIASDGENAFVCGVNGIWRRALSQMITSVSSVATRMPQEFLLQQNYPNPFNPVTTIEYQIPKKNHVILKVFDVLGREVATLMNEQKPAGIYTVQFDGSGLTSGVYFYRLQVGTYVNVKKLVLLK